MIEGVLILIGLIWIIFASIQDLRSREVANWLNFSLIIFVLGIRFFYSLFESPSFMFFYQGLIGFGIFLVLGNLFYYGRLFGGGDAKLMIALGTVFPMSLVFFENVKIFVLFLILFLVVGSIYGTVWSVVLMFVNFSKFKKTFSKLFVENKIKVISSCFVGFLFFLFGFFESVFFIIGGMIFILPYFYLYAKSVDNSCMIKKISALKLREGDLLFRDVIVGNKKVKANWEGLSFSDIRKIKKFKKHVFIREGIPFVPVFLISYVILFYLHFNSFLFSFVF